MLKKILLVDDEMSILDALKRQLHNQFHICTASDGQEGLTILRTLGPFAVVVSDCRMPGMDGIEFLSLVRKSAPNIVRMMLTGNNDVETAMKAVNKGEIFRFLTKPCPPEMFKAAIEDGIHQHQLNCLKETFSTRV